MPTLPDPSHQKPIMKLLGKMLSSRMKMPHSKVVSQSIKVKHKKKVTYW